MYITKHKYVYTIQEYFDSLVNFMIEAGWVLHDDLSSTSKVLSSNGENDDFAGTIYINIYIGGTNYIYGVLYGYWNSSTHTGYSALNAQTNLTMLYKNFISESTLFNKSEMYFVGNKDYIMCGFCLYNNSSEYYVNSFGFGTFSKLINQIKKSSTNSVSVGTDKEVILDDVNNLKINNYYQIFDKTFKNGCEFVKIKTINVDTKTVVLGNVLNNYPDGVYLGLNILPIFLFDDEGGYIRNVYAVVKSGTAVSVTRVNCLALFSNENNTYIAPSTTGSLNDYPTNIPNRNVFYDYNSGLPIGYFDENIRTFNFTANKIILKSIMCSNNDNSDPYLSRSYFTNVNNDLNVITDIRKSWNVDELVGKYIAIITGRGAGQTRQILSNTSNSITLLNNFVLNIDTTSQYIITDKVYRILTQNGYSPYANIWYRDIF